MKTIIWDVDDVLNNLTEEWFASYKYENQLPLTYEDLIENPFHKILGIDEDEYLASLDKFRGENYHKKVKPDRQIITWFEKYGKYAHHIALSAVPLNYAEISASWVIKHFGRWIRTFAFVPSKRKYPKLFYYHNSKQDYLKWLNLADIMIDDNMKNLSGLPENIKGYAVKQPWNNSTLTIEHILEELTKEILR